MRIASYIPREGRTVATRKYPKLPRTLSGELAELHSTHTIKVLVDNSATTHPQAYYGAKSGIADENFLGAFRDDVRQLATKYGYPGVVTEAQGRAFDTAAAAWLPDRMELSPAEAAITRVWTFVTCILLPDIIRWRFPGEGDTSSRYFLNIARNGIGRLWWRGFAFRDPSAASRDYLLTELNDDEVSQFIDRTSLRGNRRLARAMGHALLRAKDAAVGEGTEHPRGKIVRDVIRRLMRLLPLVSFDALDEGPLAALLDKIIAESVSAITDRTTQHPTAPPDLEPVLILSPTPPPSSPAPAPRTLSQRATATTTETDSPTFTSPPVCGNPYRRGSSYWAIVEALRTLGDGKLHSFDAIIPVVHKAMAEGWQTFANRNSRNEATGKNAIDRLIQNISVVARPDEKYGGRLRKLGFEVRFNNRDRMAGLFKL